MAKPTKHPVFVSSGSPQPLRASVEKGRNNRTPFCMR